MSNISLPSTVSKKEFFRGTIRKKTAIFLAVWVCLSLVFIFALIKDISLINLFLLFPLYIIESILNLETGPGGLLTTFQIAIRMIIRIALAFMLSWIFVYFPKTKGRRKKTLIILVIYLLLCAGVFILSLLMFARMMGG